MPHTHDEVCGKRLAAEVAGELLRTYQAAAIPGTEDSSGWFIALKNVPEGACAFVVAGRG